MKASGISGSGVLLFANLTEGLAVDAQSCGGPRFKALDTNVYTAFFAITVIAGIKIGERFIDFLNQFSFTIPGAKLQRAVSFLGCTIVRVRQVNGFVLHDHHSALGIVYQLIFPGVEDVPKMLCLKFTHIGFAPLGPMWFNSVDQILFDFLLGACHWFTLGW